MFFNENTVIGLGSHVFGLVSRIKEKEEMQDLGGDDVLNELEPRVCDLAKQVCAMLEKAEDVKLVSSEILLIAIHIQNAITNL